MKLSNTLMINESLLPSNKKAFTLAEVLITLSILGVIAALTIPSLINRYSDSAAQTKLKKAVRDYENMASAYLAQEETTDLKDLTDNNCSLMTNYMKIVDRQGCTFTTGDGVLWKFTPTVANKSNGTAVAYDSSKGPRYGVLMWTADGVVNVGYAQDGQESTPVAKMADPVTELKNVANKDVTAPINGYYNANDFMAKSSKDLSAADGKSDSIADAKGKIKTSAGS